MNIKIHRGLEQIGGCITEIWTDTSRVFIDFGKNLPGSAPATTEEEDEELVSSILKQNVKGHQAVFYTHAHEDHVGLFHHIPSSIPQYIGEGAKEILLAKYHYIIEGLKLAGTSTQKATEKQNKIETFNTWSRTLQHSIYIGDIKITPYFCCHSIYDAYMFLIEAGGKRIWHTGDYRAHGYLGKGLFKVLKAFARNIDVLITEGTMLNREDECIDEYEVSRRMSHVMQAFKYVFVLASSTDIERLATIKNAAKIARKCLYVNSGYMNKTMSIFTRREAKNSKGLFSFSPCFYSGENDLEHMKRNGFVMVTGVAKYNDVQNLLTCLPPSETILIYSSWDGYYRIPEQIEANPRYKMFREAFHNVVDIHTSGHADRDTIKKVVRIVNPHKVICIHKEATNNYDVCQMLGFSNN